MPVLLARRLLLLLLLATACAPADRPPTASLNGLDATLDTGDSSALERGWRPVDHPDGPAFLWGEGPDDGVQLVLRSTDDDEWTLGVGIIRDGSPLATRSERKWFGRPGWVPVLLAGPRTDGTPPLDAIDGDTLALALAGSPEHGCQENDLQVAIHVDAETRDIDMAVWGVPYLALPPGPLVVTDAEGRSRVTPHPDSAWVGTTVESLDAGDALGGVTVLLDPPSPWLQLQGHEDFTEVDLDHSCEVPDFKGAAIWVDMPGGPP
jgi:hypothetical protein